MKGYSIPPPRNGLPFKHDSECECIDCVTEVRARTRAHKAHARTIRCKECGARINVNGRGPLTRRRDRAFLRHQSEQHQGAPA